MIEAKDASAASDEAPVGAGAGGEPARRQIEHELAQLSRELARLRSLLRGRPEPLPPTDYDALIVEVGAVRYAMAIAAIEEVLEFVWPDPLPDTPPWILGSIHHAGAQVPIVDVRRRLVDEATPWTLRTKLVLVHHGALRALAVDGVVELIRVPVAEVTRPPADVPQSPFLLGSLGVDDGATLHLLSVERTCRELDVAH